MNLGECVNGLIELQRKCVLGTWSIELHGNNEQGIRVSVGVWSGERTTAGLFGRAIAYGDSIGLESPPEKVAGFVSDLERELGAVVESLRRDPNSVFSEGWQPHE